MILFADEPEPEPGRPYHPLTSASKFVDTAPMPNPLEPLVVTVTLRLSRVTKVPAPTKFEVKFTMPIPLVPDDPEVPEDPDEPEVPEEPEDPLDPEVPEEPEVPEDPLDPDTPIPEVPDVPEEPEVPSDPVAPVGPIWVYITCITVRITEGIPGVWLFGGGGEGGPIGKGGEASKNMFVLSVIQYSS